MSRSRTIFLGSFHHFECPMDDYLSHILELTSFISQRLIELIEGVLLGYVERGTQDFEPSLSGYDDKSVCVLRHSSHGDNVVSSDTAANINHLDCERWLVKHKEKWRQRSYQPTLLGSIKTFTARGLIAVCCGVKCGCRLISTCSKCICMCLRRVHTNVQGFISRVSKTLQGSFDDIGWLQRTEQLPPVEDGTTRFMELLHDVRSGIHHLPNTFVYLLIPGLFSNHSPLYFVSTKRFFSKMGLTCHIAKIHSEASVERNSWELKQYIEELYWGSGKRVLLLGHSKGGVDAAAALSMYWSDLKDKVAGLALVQSPYGGSPIASDVLREGQIADKETRRIMEFIICKIIKGDMRALEDLTYEKRKEFISMHRLPAEQIPLISFHTEARVAPGVLATMSHIAHAELPWLPLPKFLLRGDEFGSERTGCKLPVVIPLAAAMAVSALHLKLRYGVPSDGLVTRCDAEVPGSVVVRVDRKLDHAWMVYTSNKRDKVDADSSEMCEALLTMLVEIGRKKLGNMNFP